MSFYTLIMIDDTWIILETCNLNVIITLHVNKSSIIDLTHKFELNRLNKITNHSSFEYTHIQF